MKMIEVPVRALSQVVAALISDGPAVNELRITRGLPTTKGDEDNPIDVLVDVLNKGLIKEITPVELSIDRDSLKEENDLLRTMLFIEHMRSGHGTYTDDGQMQCSVCMIDFLTQPLEDIQAHITKQNKVEVIADLKEKHGDKYTDAQLYDIAIQDALQQANNSIKTKHSPS